MPITLSEPLFALGRLVATRNAFSVLTERDIEAAVRRHASGDWGEAGPLDREANDLALRESDRIVSVYKATDGTEFWIITEWDRSATTVLLPSDY